MESCTRSPPFIFIVPPVVILPSEPEGIVNCLSLIHISLKKGITVLNSPGTIDADYRGEICVILINLSTEPFVIEDGERIAQRVIARHEQAAWQEVEVLNETERGAGGFGHTGRG